VGDALYGRTDGAAAAGEDPGRLMLHAWGLWLPTGPRPFAATAPAPAAFLPYLPLPTDAPPPTATRPPGDPL